VLAVDLGERRIGVALSDSRGSLAFPWAVLERTGSVAEDHRAIAALVTETGATSVVVGVPVSLSGRLGPAALRAREEVAALRARLDVPVHEADERLSTVEAARRRREAEAARARRDASPRGARPGGGGRAPSSRARRPEPLDAAAAAVVLQSWLEARRGR
jgi:putative Holliday junction resolvase